MSNHTDYASESEVRKNSSSDFINRLTPHQYSGLKAHWISFGAVNGFLFLINLLTGYGYPWHLFPLLSWGIGIGIHTASLAITTKYPRGAQRGFMVHFAVFLIVNGYFLAINLITSWWYLWFIWPTLSWGIGLGEHFIAYQYVVKKQAGESVSLMYNLWYPAVVCIFLAAVDIFSGGGFGWFLWPTVPIMVIAYFVIRNLDPTIVEQHREARRASMQPVRGPSSSYYAQPPQTQAQFSHATTQFNTAHDVRFCPKCGEKIGTTNLFCEYCGQKLD